MCKLYVQTDNYRLYRGWTKLFCYVNQENIIPPNKLGIIYCVQKALAVKILRKQSLNKFQ